MCARSNSNVLSLWVFWWDCSSAQCHCKPVLVDWCFSFLYESSHGQIPFEKSALDPNVLETIRLISNLLCPNLLRKLFLTSFFVIWIKTIFGTPSSQFITQNTVLRLCVFSDLTSSDSGSISILTLLDLSAAFDTVNYNVLLTHFRNT